MTTRPHNNTSLSKGVVFDCNYSEKYWKFSLGFHRACLKEIGQKIATKVVPWIGIGLAAAFGTHWIYPSLFLPNDSAPEQSQCPNNSPDKNFTFLFNIQG